VPLAPLPKTSPQRRNRWARAVAPHLLAATFAAGMLLTPGTAKAWWNDGWSYRKPITIDAGAAGAALPGDAGRVPVLVRLHDGDFKFTDAKEDGSDLRFIAEDDKTPLKFHIEKYDAIFDLALVWVDVPDLKAGATRNIWMYYGNQKATAGADIHGTYDADYVLVYHFGEHNLPPVDASAYNNAGLSATLSNDASLIGAGAKFTGSNTIALPGTPSLATAEGAQTTWSAWIKPEAAAPTGVLYARHEEARSFVIGLDQGIPYVTVTDAGGTQRTDQIQPMAGANWHHIAITTADKITLYVDGQAKATLAATVPAFGGTASLGGDASADPATAQSGFVGELDELEISKVARSAGAIAAAAAGQGPAGKLLRYGADEQTSSWSTGYLGVILHSVTLDGWVVIDILILMALISWFVMASKARYVGNANRANASFRRLYYGTDEDRKLLDHLLAAETVPLRGGKAVLSEREARLIETAPLFRLYADGIRELRDRFKNDPPGKAHTTILSAQAIEAIRASLDGTAVRESQALNHRMVLLTIAISGGPFIGLLGTVLGVMITFASIAASGDVNVNAIAPGIAAALVATVAGLIVAIPALFGYNYLITQIKNTTNDTQVFVDSFITRLAELYRTPDELPGLAAE